MSPTGSNNTQQHSPHRQRITLLVFKDNFASRVFELPLAWISWFGITLGSILLVTGVSSFLAIKYYRQTLLTDIQQAEINNTAQLPIEEYPPTPPPAPSPAVTHATTQIEAILPSLPSVIFHTGNKIPLSIESEKILWRSRTLLYVQFTIVTKKNAENAPVVPTTSPVEGKVLILVKTQEGVFTYPLGVISADLSALILPEKGDPFSVNRLKEIKAEFGPFKSQKSLIDVEVFVFNTENQLVLHKKIPPPVLLKNIEPKASKIPQAKPQQAPMPYTQGIEPSSTEVEKKPSPAAETLQTMEQPANTEGSP